AVLDRVLARGAPAEGHGQAPRVIRRHRPVSLVHLAARLVPDPDRAVGGLETLVEPEIDALGRLAEYGAVRGGGAHQHRVRAGRIDRRGTTQERDGQRRAGPACRPVPSGSRSAHFRAGAGPVTVNGTAPSVTCPSAAITFQRAWQEPGSSGGRGEARGQRGGAPPG